MQYAALKLFLEVAELGSLSKAAALRQTTQPHISRQITELERQCGGALFSRTGRGVILSDLGERILPKVRSWVAETDQLENDIKNASGKPIGIVRIGILPSAAHPLTSTLYRRLKDSFPLIRLVVREGQGSQLESWLANGSVDLAILFRHSAQAHDDEKFLIETKTYLVGPAGDKLTRKTTVPFSALDNLPLVQFCRPNSWRDQLDEMSRMNGIVLNTILEADSLKLQIEIVSQGGGYTVLGPYAIAEEVQAGRLQAAQIVNPALTRHIALAVSRHGPLTLAGRTVMEMIQDIFKASRKIDF